MLKTRRINVKSHQFANYFHWLMKKDGRGVGKNVAYSKAKIGDQKLEPRA